MLLIRNIDNINLNNISATIGNFDGIHLAHEELIKNTKEIAKKNNLKSGLITFEPHPAFFFNKDHHKNFKIFSTAQKLRFFKNKYQLDYIIILKFNQNLAKISADDFVKEILIKKLKVKYLNIGHDFTFGHKCQGNFQTLQKYFNDNVSKIEKKLINNITCSSTNIRNFIQNSNIKLANQFLNKNYAISGLVSPNKKLGNKIGFPTANIILNNNCLKPKYGVYKTKTKIEHLNLTLNSITNFGIRPTINDSNKEIFETHIPNFNDDLYNKKITVEFIDFIRDEKKFKNITKLKQQIEQDIIKLNL